MKKPLIGMFGVINDIKEAIMPEPYVNAVVKAGGIPIAFPYLQDEEMLNQLLSMCDGYFFIGGEDVDPSRYGEEKREVCEKTNPLRDDYDFKIFDLCFKTSKPIIGICRGSQIINVAMGGTLYQDLLTDTPITVKHKNDSVDIVENTPLHQLIGKNNMFVNSFHHQAVKDVGNGLKVMAISPDGIIEGTYLDSDRYVRAYQWHPERLVDTSEENHLLFVDFINACKKK